MVEFCETNTDEKIKDLINTEPGGGWRLVLIKMC